MIEIALLVFLVGSLAAFAWVPWLILLEVALGCSVMGLLVGIPGALVYHVRLRICLLEADALCAGWWVHPFGHHRALDADQLDWVLPPMWVGAAGGAVAFLGCLIGGVGVVSSFANG